MCISDSIRVHQCVFVCTHRVKNTLWLLQSSYRKGFMTLGQVKPFRIHFNFSKWAIGINGKSSGFLRFLKSWYFGVLRFLLYADDISESFMREKDNINTTPLRRKKQLPGVPIVPRLAVKHVVMSKAQYSAQPPLSVSAKQVMNLSHN